MPACRQEFELFLGDRQPLPRLCLQEEWSLPPPSSSLVPSVSFLIGEFVLCANFSLVPVSGRHCGLAGEQGIESCKNQSWAQFHCIHPLPLMPAALQQIRLTALSN